MSHVCRIGRHSNAGVAVDSGGSDPTILSEYWMVWVERKEPSFHLFGMLTGASGGDRTARVS